MTALPSLTSVGLSGDLDRRFQYGNDLGVLREGGPLAAVLMSAVGVHFVEVNGIDSSTAEDPSTSSAVSGYASGAVETATYEQTNIDGKFGRGAAGDGDVKRA